MGRRVVIVFLPFVLFLGCVCGPVCNKPYIRVANDCCLDKNDNRICDRDEATTTTTKPATTTSSSTTTSLPPQEDRPPARGELIKLELSSPEVYVGENVKVIGTFRNLGSSDVSAVLRYNVISSENGIAVFSGEATEVAAGSDGKVFSSYTPKKPGKYVIRGRVYFLDKISSEQSATLLVKAR